MLLCICAISWRTRPGKLNMIQVYTGDGKGKTTAAFGLALRALGAGKKVYIGQFLKSGCYSEVKALKKFKLAVIEQFGSSCFIVKKPVSKDREMALSGLKKVKKALLKGKFDLVILDEINVALKLGLIESKDVIGILKSAPKRIEIVLTGRDAPAGVIDLADLVSQIKDVKHYYRLGIKARKGIEF